jgi:hypothetical protein
LGQGEGEGDVGKGGQDLHVLLQKKEITAFGVRLHPLGPGGAICRRRPVRTQKNGRFGATSAECRIRTSAKSTG